MADEILTPGKGRIRALISVGGNPEVGFPNQLKMRRALDDLELFVQIDPWMSASAKRADVVLAPSPVPRARGHHQPFRMVARDRLCALHRGAGRAAG